MDKTHEQEQAHLSEVYAKIQEIHDAVIDDIEVNQKIARQDLVDMSEEIRPDFGGVDESMETLAAIETLNSVIDAFNQRHDFALDRLRRTLLLLVQPYFAKVVLRMRSGAEPREIYIGAAGITDDNHKPLVVDWRSPVAETYYNQETGPTSFSVDGRRRDVELLGRRQFDIQRDVLRMFFDTTVAIEDPLLLQALTSHHSEKLQAITATIQREQNEVVRHEDVPALLVNGIAGSGKTSVLLQRVAFLFYRERETLSPEQVYLFTPNPIFERYIDAVLPSLGEANPQTLTWSGFLATLGLEDRDDGRDCDPARLEALEGAIAGLELSEQDFRPLAADGITLVRPSQIASAVAKFPRAPMGPRRIALAKEELHDKLDRKIERMGSDADFQEEMLSLDVDEQVRIFGAPVSPEDERETVSYTRQYLRHRFGSLHDDIERCAWLRIDRIGMSILGADALDAAEWLYLRSILCGPGDKAARFVMVDEVQDYTRAQLMVLARYFSGAHFLMLGDERQAIFEGTASFSEMREVFAATHGSVDECRLLTSYRSSPEITDLFWHVLGEDAGETRSSVRREGVDPRIIEGPVEAEGYLRCLREEIALAREQGGLCAVVCATRDRAHWLSRQLADEVVRLRKEDSLPAEGVVLMDLAYAKGLEFDQVIVADAQAEVYPDEPLARRRLYTAISRAMHRVSLLSQGEMTSLVR